MDTIAERELTYRDDAGEEHVFSIKVQKPRSDSGYWACGYEIGAPADFAATAYGEDALQALVMALHAVQAHLNAPDLRGRVRWLGEPMASIIALPSV
jgi:hypothetical protein